nr:hypothetical protein [Enterobacter bugandensis]
MAMKYLGLPAHQYKMKIDSLWPLANRLDIPYHHRVVLDMTYDRMYVKQEHYALATDCIRKYLTDFPADDKYVNHWPRIAEIFESSPECPAIGLWLTSVCENPFLGEWDEDTEDYKQPDWSRYWNLFDDLDASESGAA